MLLGSIWAALDTERRFQEGAHFCCFNAIIASRRLAAPLPLVSLCVCFCRRAGSFQKEARARAARCVGARLSWAAFSPRSSQRKPPTTQTFPPSEAWDKVTAVAPGYWASSLSPGRCLSSSAAGRRLKAGRTGSSARRSFESGRLVGSDNCA